MLKPAGFLSVFALLLVLSLAACSAKKTTSSSDEVTDSGGTSSADPVGSNPEDMLAEEAGGGNSELKELAEGDDPFADLRKEQPGDTHAPDHSAPAAGEAVIAGGEDAPMPPEAGGPSTEVADATPAVSSGGGELKTYRVRTGDTLMKIAFTIYGDVDRWRDLHEWNRDKIKNANWLTKGLKLQYEAPAEDFRQEEHAHSYTIKKGDTLANIADDVYGRVKKWSKLQKYNQRLIKNPNVIFAGFKLYYEITPQEMAEADARRREKAMLANGSSPQGVMADTLAAQPQPLNNAQPISPAPASVPSAITGTGVQPMTPSPMATAPVSPVTPVTPQAGAVPVTPVR